MAEEINVKYRKAWFNYELSDRYIAGIQLTGTEIKAIRQGSLSFVDPFCVFMDDELWVKGIHISEYSHSGYTTHDPKRDRKLLLTKKELKKLLRKMEEKGFTIVPVRCFINEKGLAKLEIALAKGKKRYDKREDIKRKDNDRDMERMFRDKSFKKATR
jgi:SsrA-binding protein